MTMAMAKISISGVPKTKGGARQGQGCRPVLHRFVFRHIVQNALGFHGQFPLGGGDGFTENLFGVDLLGIS